MTTPPSSSSNKIAEPMAHKTTVPTVVYRGALMLLGGVATAAVSYGILYSDAHNDLRYVRISTYDKDRERDKELRVIVDQQMNARLDGQDKKLDEISKDVKTLLLREGRRTPP